MKAVCVVAHPDDCIIFGYGFIYNHPEYTWDIVYVTNKKDEDRGKEIKSFWERRGVNTFFLEYEDRVEDHFINHRISFNTVKAEQDIQNIVQGYDLILTHNKDGEYGHIHHKFTHKCLTKFKNVVTFNYRRKLSILSCKLPSTSYKLSEIPIHADVVSKFHNPKRKTFRCNYKLPKDLKLCFRIAFAKYCKDK